MQITAIGSAAIVKVFGVRIGGHGQHLIIRMRHTCLDQIGRPRQIGEENEKDQELGDQLTHKWQP